MVHHLKWVIIWKLKLLKMRDEHGLGDKVKHWGEWESMHVCKKLGGGGGLNNVTWRACYLCCLSFCWVLYRQHRTLPLAKIFSPKRDNIKVEKIGCFHLTSHILCPKVQTIPLHSVGAKFCCSLGLTISQIYTSPTPPIHVLLEYCNGWLLSPCLCASARVISLDQGIAVSHCANPLHVSPLLTDERQTGTQWFLGPSWPGPCPLIQPQLWPPSQDAICLVYYKSKILQSLLFAPGMTPLIFAQNTCPLSSSSVEVFLVLQRSAQSPLSLWKLSQVWQNLGVFLQSDDLIWLTTAMWRFKLYYVCLHLMEKPNLQSHSNFHASRTCTVSTIYWVWEVRNITPHFA